MKRLVPLVLLSFMASCNPTKRIVQVAEDLTPPPVESPIGTPPDLEDLGDNTVQADEVDFFALDDGLQLQNAVAATTVWISAANYVNQELDVDDARQALELALNTTATEASIGRVRMIGQKQSLMAVNLRDFYGSRANEVWKLIEDTAVLKIQSQTTRNRQLQFLTNKRIPIMHLQVFLETAMTAKNYYTIKQVPLTLTEFFQKQGIDRQKDFDDRDPSIFAATFQISLIAPGHNRNVLRFENNKGKSCWLTNDVDSLKLVPQSNFFQFPFPAEARSPKTFVANAGEIICLQENGTMLFGLYDAAGNRANEAPTTVVVNTRSSQLGFSPEISAGRDCLGCHSNTFVLPVRDEVRRQIADNPFSANDKLLGNIFFQDQGKLDARIDLDNDEYQVALTRLGIQGGGVDPVNKSIDNMRDGYTAKELASFLYLPEDEFLERLAGSQNASNQVGQLLRPNGTLSFFALQESLKTIIDDLNLFRDVNQ